MQDQIFKNDNSRFTTSNFGSVITKSIDIRDTLLLSSIVTVNPTEGGVVNFVNDATIVVIQSSIPYVQLTFILPLKPLYGQVLIITSNVNISSIVFNGNGASFGMTMPTSILASEPLRLVYAATWVII